MKNKQDKRIYIKCSECSRNFLVAPWQIKRNSRFCSRECYRLNKNTGIPLNKNCLQCKKNFIRQRGMSNDFWTKAKFCTKKCYGLNISKRVNLICKICSKEFTASYQYRNTAKYCSKKCQSISYTTATTSNCLNCNQSFRVFNYLKNSAKYCSSQCYWKSLEGKVTWNKNIPHTEEHKQNLRISRHFQVIPNKGTSIEVKIQTLLRENNIEFETQYPILGQPDLFVKPNVCIFCDGDYWHNRPGSKERDERITKELQQQGYIVIRLWEHEINKEIESCYYKIKEILTK